MLSRFPLPMSEAEARREGRRARRSELRLPNGHPDAAVPTWIPLRAASALEQLRLRLTRKSAAGRFVLRR